MRDIFWILGIIVIGLAILGCIVLTLFGVIQFVAIPIQHSVTEQHCQQLYGPEWHGDWSGRSECFDKDGNERWL